MNVSYMLRRLTLGELGCATCSLEAVLFALLHPGVTSEEASLLEGATQLGISDDEGTGDTVTDRTGLTGGAAAVYVYAYIVLAEGVSEYEGSANDHLQGLKTEVVFDIPVVDGDVTGGCQHLHYQVHDNLRMKQYYR